jgi:cytochrome P450
VPRILFRRATAEVEIGGVRVESGDRVILNILAAHHDPEEFKGPEHLNLHRRYVRHFILGAGPHSCVGAGLIRMAMITVTRPLIEGFSDAALAQPVEFRGGEGFRAPASLVVLLAKGQENGVD